MAWRASLKYSTPLAGSFINSAFQLIHQKLKEPFHSFQQVFIEHLLCTKAVIQYWRVHIK